MRPIAWKKKGKKRKKTMWLTADSPKCLTRCSQMQTLLLQDDSTLTWLYCYRCGSIGFAPDLHPGSEQTSFAFQDLFELNTPTGMREKRYK